MELLSAGLTRGSSIEINSSDANAIMLYAGTFLGGMLAHRENSRIILGESESRLASC